MKKYTIGYIDHNQEVHARQLGPSLAALNGGFDVLKTDSKECPAANYNTMIDRCNTSVLILTHQDVTFSPDLLTRLDVAIGAIPNFGAFGMVGVDPQRRYYWSKDGAIARICSIDCCFIVIRKELGLKFDNSTFNEYHMYVEDYCGQVSNMGLNCYTIPINSAALGKDETYEDAVKKCGSNFLNHHSFTCGERGYCWGRWAEFRAKLKAKWPGIETT